MSLLSQIRQPADISWTKATLISMTIGGLLLAFSHTPYGDFVEQTIARTLEFRVRALMGKGPTLDPRIKIAAFDDLAVDVVDKPHLNLTQWRELLTA